MYLKVMMPKRFQFRMVPSFKNFLLDRKGDIHYIGGADVLPAPLEPAEEAEVIADLGTEYDTKAKTMLIEHNLRLVVYIAKIRQHRCWSGRFDFHRNDRTYKSHQFL